MENKQLAMNAFVMMIHNMKAYNHHKKTCHLREYTEHKAAYEALHNLLTQNGYNHEIMTCTATRENGKQIKIVDHIQFDTDCTLLEELSRNPALVGQIQIDTTAGRINIELSDNANNKKDMENTLCIKAAIGDEDYGLGPALSYRWTGKKTPNKSDTVCVRTPHGETTAVVCDVYLTNPIEANSLPTARAY